METFFFTFLLGTTILNLGITLCSKRELRGTLSQLLSYYWIAILGVIAVTVFFSESPSEIAFSYFLQALPTFFVVKMFTHSRQMDFNWTSYFVAFGFCSVISAGLILITPYNFTLSLIPITTSIILPFLHPIYETLFKNRRESNGIEKSLAFVFIIAIVYHLSFAFTRMKPDMELWNSIISLMSFLGLMVLLPLLVLQKNKTEKESSLTLQLEQQLKDNQDLSLKLETVSEQLNDQTSQKNQFLIGLNEQKEMNELLIRTVSHDVATPLTVINAYVDLLISGRVSLEDQPRTFDKIKNNSLAAQNILAKAKENILSQGVKRKVKLQQLNLKKMIDRCLENFYSRLLQKNMTVNLAPIDKTLFILADPDILLEHVFSNIMSNAIKFSHPHSVIDILVHEEQGHVSIIFKDYGVGITPERIKDSANGIPTGDKTGFGLKVVSYFTREQEGEFHLESPGQDLGVEACLSFKTVKSNT